MDSPAISVGRRALLGGLVAGSVGAVMTPSQAWAQTVHPTSFAGTKEFTRSIAEAEKLIRRAPFVQTEQDLAEGYEYLMGLIRITLDAVFSRFPGQATMLVGSSKFSRYGLDNPDTIYLSVNLEGDAEVIVRGQRGNSADLAFQVLAGEYTSTTNPRNVLTFDDREIQLNPDRSFELRFGPKLPAGTPNPPNYWGVDPDSTMLLVRETFNDWNTERRGIMYAHRTSSLGVGWNPPTLEEVTQRYIRAGARLVEQVRTWLAFPDLYQNRVPVNVLTPPNTTGGGLVSQRSSIGHYAINPDEALIVTVPRCDDCTYQGFQVGSNWYASFDYESHQSSLTKAQAQVDADGMIRYVVAEANPGVANWIETCGHLTGSWMLRWQQLSRALTLADGARVTKVKVADIPTALPHYTPISPADYARRISDRQWSVAARMYT